MDVEQLRECHIVLTAALGRPLAGESRNPACPVCLIEMMASPVESGDPPGKVDR